MKRGYDLTGDEILKIVTEVLIEKKSINGLAVELNVSHNKIRNVLYKYKIQNQDRTTVHLGHKSEPYWEDEMSYESNVNPFACLTIDDVIKEKTVYQEKSIEELKVKL